MMMTEITGSIIQDLDVIIRQNIDDKKIEKTKLFCNPDKSEIAIRSNVIKMNAPFHVGEALIDILDYLENRYGLDFDALEENQMHHNKMKN